MVAASLCVLLAAIGLVLVLPSHSKPKRPPTPPAPAAAGTPHVVAPSSAATSRAVPKSPPRAGCPPVRAAASLSSVPVHICIPAIGVNADVLQLGLNADRTVQVPPLSKVSEPGWYKYSPTPGALGPAIILGHIDSAQFGPGVFFKLGQLRPGDRVKLTRADGMVAEFRIERVVEVPKSRFPTAAVYGNTPNAALRLITCGGQFDASAGNYLDNIIAFGALVSLRHG